MQLGVFFFSQKEWVRKGGLEEKKIVIFKLQFVIKK
jgi:hypothetical protein